MYLNNYYFIILLQFIKQQKEGNHPTYIDPRTKYTYKKDSKCYKTYRCTHRTIKDCPGLLQFDAKGNVTKCVDHQGHAPSHLMGNQHDMFKELMFKSRTTFLPFKEIFDEVSSRFVKLSFY